MSKVNETLLKSSNCDQTTTISGVTYYKLVSPYVGDRTKNCGLVGSDIDENFFFLRGNDIEAIYCENGKLVVERVNGQKDIVVMDCVSSAKPDFEFDSATGKIIITYPDGEIDTVDGFVFDANFSISTDNTLRGNGTLGNPLRLNNAEKTGTYSPAEEYLDISENGVMPDGKYNGYRLVTKEKINNFGYLYPLGALELIQSELENEDSEWRVPEKKDWDKLLNAMESCSEYRNHSGLTTNRPFGKAAGQLLKSYGTYTEEIGDGDGFWKKFNTSATEDSVDGIDLVGMSILPAGRIQESSSQEDINETNSEVGRVASFWTNTESAEENGEHYEKTFSYKSSKVSQDTFYDAKLSIRLVKDFDGSNFNEIETILGLSYPTVLVRKVYDDYVCNQIWTKINFYDGHEAYSGVTSEEWIGEGEVAFFVNEWNGTEWEKKLMREGDSVVILEKDGLEYREWRLMHGELYDVYTEVEKIFENHFGDINETIEIISSTTINILDDLSGTIYTNGVQKVDKTVSIKIDEEDEGYLSVSENGLRTSGLTAAFDEIKELISGVTVNAAISSKDIIINRSVSGSDLVLKIDSTLKKTYDSQDGINTLGTNIRIADTTPESESGSFDRTYSLVDGEGNVIGSSIKVSNGLVKSVRLGRVGDTLNEETGVVSQSTNPNVINTVQIVYFNRESNNYNWVNIPLRDLINLGDGIKMEENTDKLYVSKSPVSEDYLTINEYGIAVTGITDAINNAINNFITNQLETLVKEIVADYLIPTKFETAIEPAANGKLRIGFAEDAIFGDNAYADVNWDDEPI